MFADPLPPALVFCLHPRLQPGGPSWSGREETRSRARQRSQEAFPAGPPRQLSAFRPELRPPWPPRSAEQTRPGCPCPGCSFCLGCSSASELHRQPLLDCLKVPVRTVRLTALFQTFAARRPSFPPSTSPL